MAKKTRELTLEEKLEQALVPREEWPYEVPENWCWTYVGSICKFIGGGTPDKSNLAYWNGSICWASVKDIKGDYLFGTIDSITEYGLLNCAANLCEVGDLILVTRIEPGKTIIAKIVTAISVDMPELPVNKPFVSPKRPLLHILLHVFGAEDVLTPVLV